MGIELGREKVVYNCVGVGMGMMTDGAVVPGMPPKLDESKSKSDCISLLTSSSFCWSSSIIELLSLPSSSPPSP